MSKIWQCKECLKKTGIDRGVCWTVAKSDLAVTPEFCPWKCTDGIKAKWVKKD